MNEYEQAIAEAVRKSVNDWSEGTERSQQSKEFRLGPSDLGFCSERVRRQLDRQEPTSEQDWNKAFIGSVLGDGLEVAYKANHPHVLTQVELNVTIDTDTRQFTMLGHADVIDPVDGVVLDFKAVNGLNLARRQETAKQGYQFQRHLYALGAWQSGLLPNHKLEDIRVGNIYYDRSGVESVPHVQIEPFSHDVIFEASQWLGEVVDRFLAGEEAEKEPAREVCANYCGFFEKCRGYDTDVEGLITDPDQLAAIDMALEARAMESQAKKLKNEATLLLRDVSGHTATHTVRWSLVNGGPVSYNRESYLRLGITKKK